MTEASQEYRKMYILTVVDNDLNKVIIVQANNEEEASLEVAKALTNHGLLSRWYQHPIIIAVEKGDDKK